MEGTTEPWAATAAILASVVLSLVAWFGSLHAVARWGGWRRLAAAYPAGAVPGSGLGETFRWRSLSMRKGVNYNHCVSLTASPSALRVSMPWIFSAGHPPIEIPWSEIRSEPGRVWWIRVVTLRCARAPSIPVHLRRGVAARLARASGGQLPLPVDVDQH